MFSRALRSQLAAKTTWRGFATTAVREADFTHAVSFLQVYLLYYEKLIRGFAGDWWRRGWIGYCETIGRERWDEYSTHRTEWACWVGDKFTELRGEWRASALPFQNLREQLLIQFLGDTCRPLLRRRVPQNKTMHRRPTKNVRPMPKIQHPT